MLFPSSGEYRVQFSVNFSKFGSADFAEKGWIFPKFYVDFSIYSNGGKFEKTGNGTTFYFSPYVFPDIFMHF